MAAAVGTHQLECFGRADAVDLRKRALGLLDGHPAVERDLKLFAENLSLPERPFLQQARASWTYWRGPRSIERSPLSRRTSCSTSAR
jgi:hypothetical protein